MLGHNGLDLYAPTGYAVYHCGPSGFVEEIVDEVSRGKGVGIVSHETYEMVPGTYQAKVRYWHLLSYLVRKGDEVKTGDLIGYGDTTGYASGPHLHMELKPVFKGSDDLYHNSLQSNGYYGAIDPMPYFNTEYAQDIPYKHNFVWDLETGDTGTEVAHLQRALKKLGYFPLNQEITRYYGPITQNAVFAFQKDWVAPVSLWDRIIVWKNLGRYCSSKTRAQLNKIFSV